METLLRSSVGLAFKRFSIRIFRVLGAGWLALALCPAGAETVTYEGASGSWTNPSVWSTGELPTLSDDVIIPGPEHPNFLLIVLSGEESSPQTGQFETLLMNGSSQLSVQSYGALQGGTATVGGSNGNQAILQVTFANSSMTLNTLTLGSGSGTQGNFYVESGGQAGMQTLVVGDGGKGFVVVDSAVLTPEVVTVSGSSSLIELQAASLFITTSLSMAEGLLTMQTGSEMIVEQTGTFAIGTVAGQEAQVTMTGGELSVSSTGSQVAVLGAQGEGSLLASDGASITTAGLVLGDEATGIGSLTLSGATLRSHGEVVVGREGAGSIFLVSGATLTASTISEVLQSVSLGAGDSEGENLLVIGGTTEAAPGSLVASQVIGGAGARVVFLHASDDYTFSVPLNGVFEVEVLHGTTRLTGDSSLGGTVSVVDGSLIVNGQHSGDATAAYEVLEQGLLGGTGYVSGSVDVHGVIAPGDGGMGTLTVGGDVTWNHHVEHPWRWDLGADNQADLLAIEGSLLRGEGELFVFDFSGVSNTGQFTLITWQGENEIELHEFWAIGFGPGHFLGEFAFDGNSLVLTVVPEPAYGLMALAVLALVILRRRQSMPTART